jgi:superfamily II DNA or RNA helicase
MLKPTTSQTLTTQAVGRGLRTTKCRNSGAGYDAWYCYHFAGRVTPGKESVNERGLCEACDKAMPPYMEAPSFMQNDEE